MIKLLDLDEPDDIVISTGKTNSVRDLCKYTFNKLGLNYKEHIKINPLFLRPQELPFYVVIQAKQKET